MLLLLFFFFFFFLFLLLCALSQWPGPHPLTFGTITNDSILMSQVLHHRVERADRAAHDGGRVVREDDALAAVLQFVRHRIERDDQESFL